MNSQHQQHNHEHISHSHGISSRGSNKKGLTIALLTTAVIMVVEFFGGLITNSLALLSDSGHMLSDVSSLALSLIAMWFASKPPSPQKTYGFYRFEILAALLNGLTLFAIAGIIIWEAYQRLFAPPNVSSGTMIAIAAIGLAANLFSAWMLIRKSDVSGNVNVRSAYLHILGDALGSIGAIIAGLLMSAFAWYIADPIISVIVALLILKSAWGIIDESIHILMEGTPPTVKADEVKQALLAIQGVKNIHDIHIWTVTSGIDSLTCHLVIDNEQNSQDILRQAILTVEKDFNIQHTTIQIETSDLQHPESII
ncbi:cation diffusion facilitator family transporter [Dendrosporobacter sp. 1207_IL3150]|uniref:cation diffusion facilitator family transporter n=1 Tax=Dendrosporobacter sp. 1207_IL3150 TaxID=3084054 RepID=UPI002FDB326D